MAKNNIFKEQARSVLSCVCARDMRLCQHMDVSIYPGVSPQQPSNVGFGPTLALTVKCSNWKKYYPSFS